jgi:acetone carboxylase gamma subunit
VADTVEAVAAGGQRLLRCTRCHHALGDYTEDYKQGTVFADSPLTTLTPLNALCQLDRYVLRQFYCPGCGTAVATDVQDADEEVRDECRLFGS